MSYILDALRKAESGHSSAPTPAAPIVAEPVPAAPVDVRRRVLLAAAIVGVGAAAAAALVGWQGLRDTRPRAVAASPASSPAARPAPTRPLSGEVVNGSGVAPREPARALDREARRGLDRAPAPSSIQPGVPVAGGAGSPSTNPAETAGQPAAAATSPRRPRGTVTVMGEGQTVPGATAADATFPARQDDNVNGLSDVPLYTDLLLSGRLNLPNLRMDMHVFNADPAKRFVFINLRKYREGERVEDRATVDTITRDGAVLSHNGVRFRLVPD